MLILNEIDSVLFEKMVKNHLSRLKKDVFLKARGAFEKSLKSHMKRKIDL